MDKYDADKIYNYNYYTKFKTIPLKKRFHKNIIKSKNNKFIIYFNNNSFFNSKKKELNMKYNTIMNKSKEKYYNNNKSDEIIKNKDINLNVINIKQNFANIKRFNINDKNKKIREIIYWLNKINKYYLIQNKIALINKVSKGVLLLNILSNIKKKLGQNKIENIINYPSNMLQIKHNFSLFWKEINNIQDMKLRLIIKYKIKEMEIISKNENIILEILEDLYNYYNEIDNYYKRKNERNINNFSTIYDNIIKKINKYSKYKYYDKLINEKTMSDYYNNIISINCHNDNSFFCHEKYSINNNKRCLTSENIFPFKNI